MQSKLQYFMPLLVLLLAANIARSQEDNFSQLMSRDDVSLREIEAKAAEYFKVHGTGKGSGYKQYQRWLYERKFHLDDKGYFVKPEKEDLAYRDALRRMPKPSSSRAATSWTALGPFNATVGGVGGGGSNGGPVGSPGIGRLTSVVVNPLAESIIYVSSGSDVVRPDGGGGIWKTTNSGATWTPLIDNLNKAWMDVQTLCMDPVNRTTIYAGLTMGGVIKQSGSGIPFAATGNGPVKVTRIIVHPTSPNIVIASALNGIWRSLDGGDNWDQVNTNPTQDLKFKPNDPSIVYATTFTNVFLKSFSIGAVWTPSTLAGTGKALLAVSPDNPEMVYILQSKYNPQAFGKYRQFGRFYRSEDAGLNFIVTVTGNPAANTNYFSHRQIADKDDGQAFHDMAIAASPSDAEEVHIAGVNGWVCFRGGRKKIYILAPILNSKHIGIRM
ncbi:MAG: WD40/YVTN/BNR-like repeat-containing protein [Saprospiraceae bacterium]